MSYDKQRVIDLALEEVGYLEKSSNSNLDSKTANAGHGNYTKYARDLDKIKGFYNGKKNGFAWCDIFVDWCFVQAFGIAAAKLLLCQPDYSAGAGCTYSAQYYQYKGRWFNSPQVGDQIFFGNAAESYHTGLVYAVDSSRVYTIEGNTSGASGVVANGGGVCKKSYSLTYNKIYGYGRPAYDTEKIENTGATAVITPATSVISGRIDTVKEVQIWLNQNYSAGLSLDGLYGTNTRIALTKALQTELKVDADGEYGPITNRAVKVLRKDSVGALVKVLQAFLICQGYKSAYVDGEFGEGTLSALKSYQERYDLLVDGEAGQETFKSLCS